MPDASVENTPTRPLQGKAALVTGGAKRVGRAIALSLAQQGMDVAITFNHSQDQANQTRCDIESLGVKALAIQADFESPSAVDQVADALVAGGFDHLRALINNASCFDATPFGQITQAHLSRNLAVNATSPILLMQKLAPMLADGADPQAPDTLGRIVNFIDIHVMGQPLKRHMAYNVSKAALMEATMTAAMELAPHITVNAIAPGVVAWAESYTEQTRREYMKRVPLARPGTPNDAAAAVLYLVKDAHYCTGQIIRLDGGRLWT